MRVENGPDGHPRVFLHISSGLVVATDYTGHVILKEEVQAWLRENVPAGRYQVNRSIDFTLCVGFLDENNLFAFKLRFG